MISHAWFWFMLIQTRDVLVCDLRFGIFTGMPHDRSWWRIRDLRRSSMASHWPVFPVTGQVKYNAQGTERTHSYHYCILCKFTHAVIVTRRSLERLIHVPHKEFVVPRGLVHTALTDASTFPTTPHWKCRAIWRFCACFVVDWFG